MKLSAIAVILPLVVLVACSNNSDFQVSKSDAESGRDWTKFDFVESFGANEGPFKSLGGPLGNYGAGISFYVTVKGNKIEKKFTPENDSYAYAADYYVNKNGDGFAVVHKRHKNE